MIPTHVQAEALWQLLDNIDTLDDSCRDNDAAFRRSAVRLSKMRFEMADSDGYSLTWNNKEPRDFAAPAFSFPISETREQAEAVAHAAAHAAAPGGDVPPPEASDS